jgi:putative holliday junction resolvase
MRIMGIDYGQKRSGIAVTDPLQIIATGLTTVDTKVLQDFLKEYFAKESVEKVVIGLPMHKDGNYTPIKPLIDALGDFITKNFPAIVVDYFDEAFTSADSRKVMFEAGFKKSQRRDKALLDKMSAVLILQRYLGHV